MVQTVHKYQLPQLKQILHIVIDKVLCKFECVKDDAIVPLILLLIFNLFVGWVRYKMYFSKIVPIFDSSVISPPEVILDQ
jgi:hypothetical protein